MKKAFVLASILFLNPLLHALEGNYALTGWDPYTKQDYSGDVTITQNKEGLYQAEWALKNGEKFQGTGLGCENHFSFVFKDEKRTHTSGQPYYFGLQLYEIKGDKITGSWVLWDNTLIGSETLTSKKATH